MRADTGHDGGTDRKDGRDEDPGQDRPDQERGDDAAWDRAARHETPVQRLDRNWNEILQELRVVQTGVQLLTGFLLTLPFQNRFTALDGFGRIVYLITVGLSVASTGFLIAPVSLHRFLFRRHARRTMVSAAHRLTLIGMSLLGAAVIGVVLVIFDVAVGRTPAIVAAVVTAVLLLGLWGALPLASRPEKRFGRGLGG